MQQAALDWLYTRQLKSSRDIWCSCLGSSTFSPAVCFLGGRALISSKCASGLDRRSARSTVSFSKYINRHGGIAILKIELFDCTMSPTTFFGLAAVPLTCIHLKKTGYNSTMHASQSCWLGAVSRCCWRETMVKMKEKMTYGLRKHTILDWSRQWAKRPYTLARQSALTDSWAQHSSVWNPVDFWQNNFEHKPPKKPGRPALKSDDRLVRFSRRSFPNLIVGRMPRDARRGWLVLANLMWPF